MSAILGTLGAKLIGTVAGKVVLAIAVAAVIGFHVYERHAAYNRGYGDGVTETTERMKKAIEEMRKIAVSTQSEWQKKTPGEKTTELQKRCVAACQQEPKCEAACKN